MPSDQPGTAEASRATGGADARDDQEPRVADGGALLRGEQKQSLRADSSARKGSPRNPQVAARQHSSYLIADRGAQPRDPLPVCGSSSDRLVRERADARTPGVDERGRASGAADPAFRRDGVPTG